MPNKTCQHDSGGQSGRKALFTQNQFFQNKLFVVVSKGIQKTAPFLEMSLYKNTKINLKWCSNYARPVCGTVTVKYT